MSRKINGLKTQVIPVEKKTILKKILEWVSGCELS